MVDNEYEEEVKFVGYYNDEFDPMLIPYYPVDLEEYPDYVNKCTAWDKEIPTNFTQDITINAVWTQSPRTLTLEYYINGKLHIREEHLYQDELVELGVPSDAEGNQWAGWRWSIPNSPTSFSAMPTTMPGSNLRADGTITKFYVIYATNGIEVKRVYSPIGASVTIESLPVEEGYSFSDWICQGATPENNSFVMPSSNVTLNTSRTANEHTVSYKIDGVLDAKVENYKYKSTVALKSKLIKLGYTFSGWSTNDAEVANESFVMPNRDVLIEGNFVKNTYNVFYNVDNEILYTDTVSYQDTVILRENESKNGFIFSEWSTSDVSIFEGEFVMPEYDVTIYGAFSSGEYCITYNFNDEFMTSRYADAAETVLIPSIGLPVPKGYEITSWNSDDVQIAEDSFSMPEQNITINAIGEAKIYNVIYRQSEDGEVLASYEVTYGTTVSLDSAEYLQHGKYVESWRLSEYSLGIELNENTFVMPSKDVIFIANWNSCLTVSDGSSIDRYDTDSPSFYGYTFDNELSLLTIEGDNLIVSGKIENVLIYIKGNATTLRDLEVTSSVDGYFYSSMDMYEMNDGYFYNSVFNCETDAVIIVDVVAKWETELFIEGTVKLYKNDLRDELDDEFTTKRLAGISTIDSEAQMKIAEGSYSVLEEGIFSISGIGNNAKLEIYTTNNGVNVDNYCYGIFTQVDFNMSNLTCNIDCTENGIWAKNTVLTSLDLTISVLPNNRAILAEPYFSGNLCELTIDNCKLDILGVVYAMDDLILKGDTNGSIHSLATFALYTLDSIILNLNEQNQIRISVSGGTDITAVCWGSSDEEELTLTSGKIVAPENAVTQNGYIGTMLGDIFVPASVVILGNIVE